MAVSPGPTLVLCLLSVGLLNSSPLDSCPDFCTCEHFSHVNCSSAGLSLAPQNIQSSVSDLDLSDNQLGALTFKSKYYGLHKVWLGGNSIRDLSLCVESDGTNQGRSQQRRGLGPWRRGRCLLWAPTLKLLSVENNQLQKLPQGLGRQSELRVLNLSFNQISKLEPDDFTRLRKLEELHLQHNHITFIHPMMFDKLDQLKVLNLGFNLLTTLHPATYISLRDFGADVVLNGNSWICDCSMQFLQREMTADIDRAIKTWSIECTSPLTHSGMNLLELDEEELKCTDSESSGQLRKEVTVQRGARILLTCSEPDAVWWTPNGQTIKSQDMDGLLIEDITEQDEGLYLCMSQLYQTLSIFNLQIQEKIRKSRSVSEEIPYLSGLEKATAQNETTGNVSQSHFAMAVSLSVIITFIVAFILGVLLQPYICACWQKAKARKQKPQTTSVSNVQQEQYINDAYLHCEDVDDFEPHRERRITFTEYTEEGDMQYYDTVAGDEQGNGAVRRPGQVSSESSDESGSEDGKRNRRNVKFEHIPDSTERNSLSSQSSVEGKIMKKDCSTPNTSQTIEERVQKTEIATIEVTEVPIESSNDVPGFSSEPFADWSPHQQGSSIMNPDLDNGEQFEFSDSVRSGSPISPSSLNESFKGQNLLVPKANRKIRFESSSSSSSSDISDSEPTHYTVNAGSEDEAQVFEKNIATGKTSQTVKSSSSSESETESHHVVQTWPAVDLEHIPAVKRRMIITTFSEETAVRNELQTLPHIDKEHPIAKKRRAPLPPPRKHSSSSSSSEDDIQKLTPESVQLTKQESKMENYEQHASWPVINLEHVAKVKRRIDFKVRYAAYESFSSSDATTVENPIYSKQESSMPFTDIKPQSDSSSSSSESEEEQEHYYESIQEVTTPNKLPVVTLEQEPLWPVINLLKVPKVKRSLNFKRAAPTVENKQLSVTVNHVQGKVPVGVVNLSKPSSGTSSSSESEDEQEHYYENFQELTSPNKLPIVTLEQEPQWPVINLAKVPKVKRSLNFKRSVPVMVDTSSSSDSEDEQLSVTVTHVQGKVPVGMINLSKPSPGASSSSESEDEQEHYYENSQELTSPNKLPIVTLEQEPQWPVINLVKVPKVKRSLEFKRSVPVTVDTSSSSDSEDEQLSVTATHVQGKVPVGVVNLSKSRSGTSSSSESEDEQEIFYENFKELTSPNTQPIVTLEQETTWPVINLVNVPKVKRSLDFKRAAPTLDTSSSSDSEDEQLSVTVTHVQGKVPVGVVNVSKPSSGTSSSSESEDEQDILRVNKENLQQTTVESPWPVINLGRIPKVKRRLDIKERVHLKATPVPEREPMTIITAPKPDSGTSSSSESEDEHEAEIVYKEQVQQVTSLTKPTAEALWPVIDLVRIPKVKRRMDINEKVKVPLVPERLPSMTIKIPKPESGTSSSSESEDEGEIKEEKLYQKKVPPPNRQPIEAQWPMINLVNVPKVKRRLDFKERVEFKVPERVSPSIKVPKRYSTTSSSSDSEDEQEHKIKEDRQWATSTIKPSAALESNQWPVIDLVKIPKVKQRLDVKTIAQASESSSSDSEDERVQVNVTQVQGKLPAAPVYVHKPDSGTSSSSESEDEQNITNRKPTVESQWPVIDFVRIPKVKRRLDIKERVKAKVAPERVPSSIKVPNSDSGTSSSSESEDEEIKVKVNEENFHQTISPIKPTTALKPHQDSQWPMINLVKVSKVKRRLDVKTIAQASESSSSDSEDERVQVNVTQVQGKLPPAPVYVQKPDSGTSSSSESKDEQNITSRQPSVDSQWPVVDFVRIPKVKRRLDIKERVNAKVVPERVPSSIKVPNSDSGTSSSSDSEDDVKIKVHQTISPIKPTTSLKPHQDSQWPMINLVKMPKVKRRLDVKTTALTSESSSSDSEDERVQVNVTQVQGNIPSTLVNVQKQESSTSSSSDSEKETPHGTDKPKLKTQWPTLALGHTGKLKRRLDFKVKLASSKLTFESESDQTFVQERLPPIKSPKPESESSSGSESEDDHETREVKRDNVLLVTSSTKQPTDAPQWPVINPVRIPKLKRRLDIKEKVQEPETRFSTIIKVPKSDSSDSSSSESEEEQQIKTVQQIKNKQPTPESPWPVINLVRIPKLKQRLDFKERPKATVMQERVPSMTIKAPKQDSGTSSSSESENEEMQKVGVTSVGSRVEPQTEWPVVNTEGITRIKRRLDFKIPLQSPPLPISSSGGSQQTIAKKHSSSSSSSDEEHIKSSQISVGQTRFPSLDVKGPSTKPGLHDSSSSSDDENGTPKFSSGSVKSQDKHFIKVSPLLSPTLSPTKTMHKIELEKYKEVTDDLKSTSSSNNPSPAVTPELQSKWANMNLGLSRFRKRLDITKTSNPSSPPLTSPKHDILITGLEMPYTKKVIVTEQVTTAPRREQNVDSSSSSSESEDDLKLDGKPSRVEVDFVSPRVGLSKIPKVKRSLNVTAVGKKSSSSSSSDEESVKMVPDLSTGIPRVKRRLNVKAPTPPPSSSSSDDEKVYAHKFSDVTDQRSIEYKRTIMKSSSYDSSASWKSHRELPYVESSTQSPKKLSLDNIKRKLLPSKQNELPPNLRWTSVGSHLSEHPIPISRRHHDGYTSPPPMSSLPPTPKQDSSDSSSSDDEEKRTRIVTQTTYNPRSVSFNTSPTILTAANFEARTELRGLSALKAKSSDRKIWESETEVFTESAPVSVDYPSEVYKRTVDTKTKISHAQSYSVSTSSPTTEERRLADMMYGIPSYKRHIIKSTELPEDPPPPIPSSPLPDESTDFTWRSPQSSMNRGNFGLYRIQQQRTVEESVDEPFHDNPNISAV